MSVLVSRHVYVQIYPRTDKEEHAASLDPGDSESTLGGGGREAGIGGYTAGTKKKKPHAKDFERGVTQGAPRLGLRRIDTNC